MIVSLIIAGIIVVLDQLSKYLIVHSSVYQGHDYVFIPKLLTFTYSENDGMAFGIGSESFRWIFIVITLAVCGYMIYLMTKDDFKHKLYFISSALIIGGGIGNLIDRALNGYVVDFLQLSFFSPICNLADYAITAGTIMLIVFIIFFYGKNKNESKDTPSDETEKV